MYEKSSYGFVAQIANSAREICCFSNQSCHVSILREVEGGFQFRFHLRRMIQQLLSWSGLNRMSIYVIYRPIS